MLESEYIGDNSAILVTDFVTDILKFSPISNHEHGHDHFDVAMMCDC